MLLFFGDPIFNWWKTIVPIIGNIDVFQICHEYSRYPSENQRQLQEKTVQKCFTHVPGRPDFWKCGCGKILRQLKATGWTNLVAHIRTQHGESSTPSSQKTLQFQCKNLKQCMGGYVWFVRNHDHSPSSNVQ